VQDNGLVKGYKTEFEANLACATLQRAGIQAKVHRFSRYRALAGSGYLVKTDLESVPKARILLDKIETGVDLDEYIDETDTSYRRCPKCRSANVEARPLSGGLTLLAVATLGIALFFIHRDWRCGKCGQHWRT
jgi:hypothetical protein